MQLTKDFKKEPVERIVTLPGVGDVQRRDVSLLESTALQAFYERNYRPGYILRDQEIFAYQFQNNGGRVSVLEKDGEVIAHQGHVPVIFSNSTTDFPGFFSASTMTDVNHRRKGLMSFLRNDVQSGYDMAASIGGSAMGIRLYTKMGYRLYGSLTRMIGVVNKAQFHLLSKNAEGASVEEVKIAAQDSGDVRRIERFSAIGEHVEALRKDVFTNRNMFGVKRDASFLDWRYVDHPRFTYERYGLWEGALLKAIVVFRREEVEHVGFVIRITEMIGDIPYLTALVSKACLQQHASDVIWIDWFCTDPRTCEALRPLGFVEDTKLSPIEVPIWCNPVDYAKKSYPFMFWAKDAETFAQAPMDLSQWYVTKGDGDADRPNDNWVTPVEKDVSMYTQWNQSDQLQKFHEPRELFRSERHFLKQIMRDNMRVFDVGCGSGAFYHEMKNSYQGLQYTGVDISPGMITRAKQLAPEATFAVANVATEDIFAGEMYDLTYATGVFQHEPRRDALLQNMLDKTIEGGYCLFDVKLFHSHPMLRDIDVSYCKGEERMYYIVYQINELLRMLLGRKDVAEISVYGYYSGKHRAVVIPDSITEDVCSAHILLKKGARDTEVYPVSLSLPHEFQEAFLGVDPE